MSEADNLLATLSVDYSDESYIYVNDDRTIMVPDELKHIAVEHDHNIETVTIDCPRYWDGHDFSAMTPYVNYMRPDGYKDSYRAKNLRVSDEDDTRILFDWTISANVTQIKGNLSFLVYIEDPDANPCWHSRLNQQMIIDEGLTCKAQIELAPDSIEEVLARTTVSYIEKAKAEIEGKTALSLASIPEDYTTVNNMAEEALREKANIIKMEAEGETITVSDSADNSLLGLKLFGKTTQVSTTGKNLAWANINIADQPYLGVICSETDDGNVLLCGTSTGNMWNRLASAELVGGQTYTLSSHKAVSLSVWDVTANGSFTVKPSSQDSITFVAPNTGSYSLCIENATGALFECIRADIMLNIGENALPWEAYSGGVASPSPEWPQELASFENPTMRILGKNVWDHEYDTVDMSNVQGWGNPIWLNDAVVDALLPDTIYTLKFDVTCLSVPAYESLFSDDCGFVLYSSKPGATVMVMAEDTGNGAFRVGEKRTVTGTFKTPSNLREPTIGYEIFRYTQRYLKSDGNAVHATVKFENVQLEIGDQATEYVPCDPTQTLSLTRSLPGIPVSSGGNYTDSDGQQWVCDEIDFERGVYIKRVAVKSFDESNTWTFNQYTYDTVGLYVFGTYVYDIDQSDYNSPVFCDRLSFQKWGNQTAGNTNKIYTTPGYIQVYLADQTVATAEAFTTWVAANPLTVQYILKTPIETPLTDAELASFKMVRSNYPSTTVLNDSGAHMSIKYAADTKTYVDNNSLTGGILVDTATGKAYRLVVTNGQLTLAAV